MNIQVLSFFVFCAVLTYAQEKVVDLPPILEESSALICINDSTFITLNDSGNKPELYVFNQKGEVYHTCFIKNAKNVDWEAMTTDGENRIFIGDIGNNKNKRKNLGIYTVQKDEVLLKDSTEAKFFSFSYPEQKSFPPPNDSLYFDAEALIYKNDSLFIFTKNRTEPFDGKALLYGLSTEVKKQEAKLYPYIQLKKSSWLEDSVTDAFYENEQLFLLTYSKIYVFEYKGGVYEETDVIIMENITQKEAVFYLNGTLYLTDEKSKLGGQKLYKLNYKP